MAGTQAIEGDFSSCTFFGVTKNKFPVVKVGDQLEIDAFLRATRELLPFIDKLGKAFGLVKKDMQGNVEKIEKHRSKDPSRYLTINSIVEEDQSAEKKGISDGCVGVLWLKRALDFIHAIFSELVADFQSNNTDENLSPVVSRAYTATLEKYHGWLTQKMIKGVIKLAPYKKDFMKNLMTDESATNDMVVKDIQLYDVNLHGNILLLNDLLTQCGKNLEEKV